MKSPSEQITMLKAVLEDLPLDGSITLLTGVNGSGKSLIRKHIHTLLPEGRKVVHTSMDLRTGLHSGLGGFGVFLRDDTELATGKNTVLSVRTALKSCGPHYLCLDEIETGLGDELLMGLIGWLNDHMREALLTSQGCLVITHSRLMVEHLRFDRWVSLDGYPTPEAWLSREVVPLDVDTWLEEQAVFFRALQAGKVSTK